MLLFPGLPSSLLLRSNHHPHRLLVLLVKPHLILLMDRSGGRHLLLLLLLPRGPVCSFLRRRVFLLQRRLCHLMLVMVRVGGGPRHPTAAVRLRWLELLVLRHLMQVWFVCQVNIVVAVVSRHHA